MNDPKVEQILRNVQNIDIVKVVIILAVAWLLAKAVERFLPWLAERVTGRLRLYILPSVPVLRLVILIGAIVSIVPLVINLTFSNSLAIIGATGFALGFAVKDYVSSIIAGIVSLYERPYRPGDWVQIDGAYGEVQSVKLRALRLVTPDDTVVTIPSLKLWNTNIFNANDGRRNLMCVVDFYLEPRHDAALVRQTLYDVALTSPYINLESPILVIVAEKPWGTHYKIKAYPVDSRDQFQFISDLTIRGKSALVDLKVQAVLALPALAMEELQQPRG
ncbi:MAG: mechanosensitive ion channel [Syntrophobacterales bacterium]|jgi:small conductance mechanosensitive channel